MSSTPPPIPPQQPIALEYATPVFVDNRYSSGFWARGEQLITTHRCHLPEICIKCGQPATSSRVRTFYWHTPWLYIMILFPGLLIYALVAIIVRKKADIRIGLCDEHARSRTKKLIAIWLMFLIGVAMLVLGIIMLNRGFGREWEDAGLITLLLSLVVMIVSGVLAAVMLPLLKPRKMDDVYAWFKGASPEFLRQIPSA